jgi:hypothetical protein
MTFEAILYAVRRELVLDERWKGWRRRLVERQAALAALNALLETWRL